MKLIRDTFAWLTLCKFNYKLKFLCLKFFFVRSFFANDNAGSWSNKKLNSDIKSSKPKGIYIYLDFLFVYYVKIT